MEGFGILCHPCNGFLDQRVWEVDELPRMDLSQEVGITQLNHEVQEHLRIWQGHAISHICP